MDTTSTMDDSRVVTSGPAREASEPAVVPKGTVRDLSTSSAPTIKKLQPKRSPSATNSPIPSREGSPVRPTLKSTTSTTARPLGPGRSRKNSANDVSPSRPASTSTNPPSAAAQQRALSAAATPTLHPATPDPTIKAPIPQKPSLTSELKD